MPQLQTTCYQQLDFFSALFLTNRHAYYKEYDTYCHTTQTHVTNVTKTYRQLNAWQKKAYSKGISCYLSKASKYNSGYFTSSFLLYISFGPLMPFSLFIKIKTSWSWSSWFFRTKATHSHERQRWLPFWWFF